MPSQRIDLQGFQDGTVFRSLFAAYPDALLLVEAGGAIVLANPAAAELLGYRLDELIGLAVEDLVPDSIRPRHAAYRGAYAQHPRARPMGTQMELVAKRRDGSEVMVEIALSPLQEHGLPYVVAAIRGIGAYPRVRQALERARYSEHVAQFGRLAVDARDPRSLLATVAELAGSGLQVDAAMVCLLEPDGLSFRVAGATGLLPGQALGELIANRADTLPGRVLAEGMPIVVDARSHAEDATLLPRACLEAGLLGAIAVPLSDRGRTVGALIAHARAERHFGDEERRFLESLSSLLATTLQRAETEEALNHAQRLESVGQLTGGIAHDFNNLLTVISGNLQVLEDLPAVAGDAFGQQLVAAAGRATRRAAELTSKLLAFSRRQVLQPDRVDAVGLLHSLSDMLRRTLDQRIAITLDAPADCPPLSVDPGQLESALLNIAINARDAMPEGGTLAFRCHLATALPPSQQAELGNAAHDYVALAIADTGTGMPESVKERAFEPFFTTKEVGRGTGLGLSTVYGFAKQSRGAVAIDSTVGAGTTVTLYLPRLREEAVDPGSAPASVAPLPRGLRVLLVEDDVEVRAVVRHFLLALGCLVTACNDAEQALATLAPPSHFDLLLSDIALGSGMRGTELAVQARQRQAGLPVLLMSGFASGLLDEPTGFPLLRKPYGRDELAEAIAKLLQGG